MGRKEKEKIAITNALILWILVCYSGLDVVMLGLLLPSLIALDELSCLLSDGVH